LGLPLLFRAVLLILVVIKEVNFNKLSDEEWNWLIGLFIADGSKAKELRTFRTYFYLNSKKDFRVLQKLEQILDSLNVRRFKQIKRRGTLYLRISCKRFYEAMPDKQKGFVPTNIEAFIAGFIDGDGYITERRGVIGFSQTIVKWIGPFIADYLESRGIKPWKRLYYRNCFYYATSLKQIRNKTQIVRLMAGRQPTTSRATVAI